MTKVLNCQAIRGVIYLMFSLHIPLIPFSSLSWKWTYQAKKFPVSDSVCFYVYDSCCNVIFGMANNERTLLPLTLRFLKDVTDYCLLVVLHFYSVGLPRLIWGTVFIHSIVCLTTGPKPLPKRALHIVRSRASSFKWEYPLLSLRSSSSFLRLLPCLPVTSVLFTEIIRNTHSSHSWKYPG